MLKGVKRNAILCQMVGHKKGKGLWLLNPLVWHSDTGFFFFFTFKGFSIQETGSMNVSFPWYHQIYFEELLYLFKLLCVMFKHFHNS